MTSKIDTTGDSRPNTHGSASTGGAYRTLRLVPRNGGNRYATIVINRPQVQTCPCCKQEIRNDQSKEAPF